MSQEDGVSTATADRLMTVDVTEPSHSCNRRYSAVMREYVRRKRQDGNTNISDTNIKPSEVLTHMADHSGPRGCSYVRWDNLDTPKLLSLNAPVPVVEDSSDVRHVQEKKCSPGLSPISTVTPESGADSFTTANSHLSSHPSASFSPMSVPPDLAEGYFLPRDSMTSIGLDGFRPKDSDTSGGLKAPVINVYSAGGSQKNRHNEGDCCESESRCLTVQPCQSASKTFVVIGNRGTFREDRHSATTVDERTSNGNESVESDVSLMREATLDSNDIRLSPIPLNFDQESFSSALCQCYPPEEKETSSYNLMHTSLESKGGKVSPASSWQPSRREVTLRPVPPAFVAARIRKLKRLRRLAFGIMVLSVVIIFTGVLIYFILE